VSRNLGGFSLPVRNVAEVALLKRLYAKPALTFAEQVSHLQMNGVMFTDIEQATQQLSCISYYRLSAYWYPFRIRGASDNVSNQFEQGTNFQSVIDLYEFDRKLRGLVLDAIERVEVAVRTQFTYHIGHKYGAFGHVKANNFHSSFNHKKWLDKLKDETKRSRDEFVAHYQSKYEGFPVIPIWMLTELMSLGALSFGYTGLKNNQKAGVEDKKAISQHFNLHHKRLGDWLHTLTYIRNICAHHSRLWNRELAIRPGKKKNSEWSAPITPRSDRIFYILLILRYLLRATGNGDNWAKTINELLAPIAKEKRWRAAMGLPENWQEHPLWL